MMLGLPERLVKPSSAARLGAGRMVTEYPGFEVR